ncbi:MAG TPA: FtsX-like permease family protein, partial [Candidatus Babeliales bacterium]|nr:FtsX-like permease family protein [Candidatus Babeliales bacterium]
YATKQFVLAATEQRLSPALVLKGIDPRREAQVTQLAQLLNADAANTNPLLNLATHQLLIGAQLAANYDLKVGDEVQILIPQTQTAAPQQLTFHATNVTIAGIFKTGVDDFDQNLAYCRLDFMQQLFPDAEVSCLGLHLPTAPRASLFTRLQAHAYAPAVAADPLLLALQRRCKLVLSSWQELYAPLMSALKLEKYVMLLILALISLMAASNLSSLLFLLVQQQRTTIAVLLTLGASLTQVRGLFISIGLLVAGVAASIGLSSAYLLGDLIGRYQLVPLPEAYLVSYLPVSLEPTFFGLVGLLALILGLLASSWPLRTLRTAQLAALLQQRI